MTGRRTLFFLEANWPPDILAQKETHDIPVYYYPGIKCLDLDLAPLEDPSKLWFTEKFFPGLTLSLFPCLGQLEISCILSEF